MSTEPSIPSVAFYSENELIFHVGRNFYRWPLFDAEPEEIAGSEGFISAFAVSEENGILVSADRSNLRTWILFDYTASRIITTQSIEIESIDIVDEQLVFSGHSREGYFLDLSSTPPKVSTIQDTIVPENEYTSSGIRIDLDYLREDFELWIHDIGFSPDARYIATADQSLTLWQSNGDQFSITDRHPSWPSTSNNAPFSFFTSVAFSSDGKWVAAGHGDGYVMVQYVGEFTTEDAPIRYYMYPTPFFDPEDFLITSVDFSPDDQLLAYGGEDGSVHIWSVENPRKQPIVHLAHTESVADIEFSPDGQQIASSSHDGTIKIWAVDESETPLVSLNPENSNIDGEILSIAYSSDGRFFAAASTDSRIRIWNVGNWADAPITILAHNNEVTDVKFQSTTGLIYSSGTDGTIRQHLTLNLLVDKACGVVKRNMTWEEWQTYLPGEQNYHQTCPDLPIHPSVPEEQRP